MFTRMGKQKLSAPPRKVHSSDTRLGETETRELRLTVWRQPALSSSPARRLLKLKLKKKHNVKYQYEALYEYFYLQFIFDLRFEVALRAVPIPRADIFLLSLQGPELLIIYFKDFPQIVHFLIKIVKYLGNLGNV